MPAKTPQDHQPKDDGSHTFEATVPDKDGKPVKKKFKLPPMSEDAAANIPGDVTYDAIMRPDDDFAKMRLAFATLEAVKPTDAAMKALKSLPTTKMIEVVGEWMGKSSSSSD